MYSTNSADPSCSSSNSSKAAAAPAPASPMEVDNLNSLELEEITLVGGQDDHLLEAGHHEGHGEGRRHRHRDRAPKEAPCRSRRHH